MLHVANLNEVCRNFAAIELTIAAVACIFFKEKLEPYSLCSFSQIAALVDFGSERIKRKLGEKNMLGYSTSSLSGKELTVVIAHVSYFVIYNFFKSSNCVLISSNIFFRSWQYLILFYSIYNKQILLNYCIDYSVIKNYNAFQNIYIRLTLVL